ncbi:MAG: tetratricopeptide repeat protein, partial [Pseudomonadota bacterium]
IAMGEQALTEGDAQRAAGIFAQVVEFANGNVAAHAGLVRAMIALGQVDEARQALAAIEADPSLASDPAITAAKAALELAGTQVDDGELADLKAAVDANPSDMDAGMAYAEAAFVAGDRDAAADTLLAMVTADREWNEGAARTKLLQIFEAVGLEDAWVVSTRRRLSKILFG